MRIRRVLENQFVDAQEGVNVRLIVVAQSLLFLYGITQIVHILLRDFQRTHAVAFEPERQRKVTRRQRFVVIRALCRSGAVHRAAGIEDVLEMSGLGNIFGSLKHHVLEQVGKAGAAYLLITRADIVIKRDGHNRYGVVFAQNYAKPVGKIKLLDGGW